MKPAHTPPSILSNGIWMNWFPEKNVLISARGMACSARRSAIKSLEILEKYIGTPAAGYRCV
jgi:hypothetical protein